MSRVLLTNVRPELVRNGGTISLMDPFGERFTRGQGVFTLTGHLHHVSTHMLAQNIQAPAVVLEWPTLEDFRREVRKGYDLIGISFLLHHTPAAMEMCRIVRQESPNSTIVIGGHGTMSLHETIPDATERAALFDHVCHGDGIGFLRELLGEPVDAPIRQGIFPRNGMAPPWVTRYPPGMIAPLVAGYGCTWRCEFCASARFWDHRRLEFADAEALYAHIQQLYRVYPRIEGFFIIDEDWFIQTKTIRRFLELIRRDTSFGGLSRFNFITESSIAALCQFDPDELLLSGLFYVFIGYESAFADALGFPKRYGEAQSVFQALRERGILQNAAMMVGWDFHTPANLPQDLEYLVGCEPTFTQFSRVVPYPGTALWDRLDEEGRLDRSVPWQDYHNYGGSYCHRALTPAQIHAFIEDGYREIYERLGPSLFRMIETFLNGYEYCLRSPLRELREDKAAFFRKRLRTAFPMLEVCRRFGPTPGTRVAASDAQARYRDLVGPPTFFQRVAAQALVRRVDRYAKQQARTGRGAAREYPCKRYVYDRTAAEGTRPFRVEYDQADTRFRVQRRLLRLAGRG